MELESISAGPLCYQGLIKYGWSTCKLFEGQNQPELSQLD